MLVPKSEAISTSEKAATEFILLFTNAKQYSKPWTFGRTKIFLKEQKYIELEKMRDIKLHEMASKVQYALGTWHLRKAFLDKRKAALSLQTGSVALLLLLLFLDD
jgi:myosin heavy subunit